MRDVSAIEQTLEQLRLALAVGALVLLLVALLVARVVARGVLAPVEAASRAAERIAGGDLVGTGPGHLGRRVRGVGRAVQPDGRGARRDDRPARGGRGPEPPFRRGRRARAADAARRARRRGLDPARPPRRAAAREPPGRRAAGRRRRPAARAGRRPDGGLAVRCPRGADRARARSTSAGSWRRSPRPACPRRRLSVPGNASSSRPTRAVWIGSSATSSTTPASTHPAPRSRSASRRPPDELVIAVADRGPGLPPEQLPHIFERFYKADPSRHGGSSGLGLAIAAEHAALLGGYLAREPARGRRSAIELRLPVTGSLRDGDGPATGRVDGGTPITRTQEPRP